MKRRPKDSRWPFRCGIIFVEQISQTGDAECDGDLPLCVAREVGGEAVVLEVVRDEHGVAARGKHIGAREEVAVVDLAGSHEAVHGDLHERDDLAAHDIGLGAKGFPGAAEHVEVHIAHGAEAAALDEDVFLAQHLGGLEHGAVGGEHGGIAEAEMHELQAHEPRIDMAELDAGELDHVDLDPLGREIVQERFHELLGLVMQEKGAVEQVHADDAERLLLQRGLDVQHANVDDDLAGFIARMRLEFHTQPWHSFVP